MYADENSHSLLNFEKLRRLTFFSSHNSCNNKLDNFYSKLNYSQFIFKDKYKYNNMYVIIISLRK